MRKANKCISVIIAAMMAVSLLSTAAYADTDVTTSQTHATGRINVDNLARGGYAASEENGGAFIPRKATDVTYPEKYSSVDEGYITSVKDQGDYGTCWAQSAAASAEASLIKNNGYSKSTNLSELHLSYFMYSPAYDSLGLLSGDESKIASLYAYRYSFLDMGGSNSFTPFTLARWTGLVDENENPQYAYSKASSRFTVYDKKEAYSLDAAHLTDAYWVSPKDLDDMKYMITKYGAGTIAYYAGYNSAYNSSTAAYYYRGSSAPNHEVTVVGWDDNYSKENFSRYMRPSKDGAWLVKNSWNTTWGKGGYFWLSYEDTSLCSDVASFYAFEANDNYDNNYQYDGTSVYDYEEVKGSAYEANVFTVDSAEYLKAVSFWTAQQNVSYSIQVYTGLRGEADPTNGTMMFTEEITGTETYAGYHTIKLPRSVYLSAGEKYSVVVKLTSNSEDETYVFIDEDDATSGWIVFMNNAQAGQSFSKSESDLTWTDKSKKGINYRIKAFTDEAEDSVIVTTDTSTDTESETDSVSDSDFYYGDYGTWFDWSVPAGDTYIEVTDTSELKDGDKIILFEPYSSHIVMPSMGYTKNVLTAAKTLGATAFSIDQAWTVKLQNDNMYLATYDGKRLTSYDKNDVSLENRGSSLLFKETADGKFKLFATGSERYLRYNAELNGYRFYKEPDETSDFVIYKKVDNALKTMVIPYGDVTGDGELSMLDVVETQRLIAKLADDKTQSLKMLADLDADGLVTMQDVVAMQRHIAGLDSQVLRASKMATLVFEN